MQLDVDGRPGFEWIPVFDPEAISFVGNELPDPWLRGYTRNTRLYLFTALRAGTHKMVWLHKRRWETTSTSTFEMLFDVW